jgi:hypothetical protein
VLASDSQGTHGGMKRLTPKLFKTKSGLIWGSAGPLAAPQALYTELEKLDLRHNPHREEAKAGIRHAMRATAADLTPPEDKRPRRFEALFAWYGAGDRRHYLLRAQHDGQAEFMTQYGAVGSSKQLAEFGFFGFSRSEFLGFQTLPLETAKMLAYMVAEDAVHASAQGVDGPIQLAVVESGEVSVLGDKELQPVRDTAAAFQMHQLDFLVRRRAEPSSDRAAKGLIPGDVAGQG